jgi:argininosuccinate synthase
VTVTLDVGQGDDLAALRARAISVGAIRAHAIDARDELAREFLLPSLDGRQLGVAHLPRIDELVRPLIARKLVEVARIEGARVVAHGSTGVELAACIRDVDPAIDILAPAGEDGGPLAGPRINQHLWGRMVSWPSEQPIPEQARARQAAGAVEGARLDIQFERGWPVSLNGVPMSPVELVESVTLIAGRHGVGRLEADRGGQRLVYDAPAAVVLHAARAAAGERSGLVRLAVLNGHCTVVAPHDPNPQVVNHA